MNHNIYDWQTKLLWKDENFDLTNARTTAGVLPDLMLIPGTNIEISIFDGVNTTEGISSVKELNHDYRQGTLIYPHVHWYPTVSGIGNVKWNFEYWARGGHDYSTMVTSGMLSVVSSVVGKGAWEMIKSNFEGLNLGDLANIGTQIHFHFYRNPADDQDTYGSDAAVATLGWHYLTDMRGSDQISSKTPRQAL